MAHYAFLDNAGIVTEVIVGKDETETIEGLTPEQWYAEYRGQTCIRTSYNSRIRKNYAGIGYEYRSDIDAFLPPKCHEEAVLDTNTALWICNNEAHTIRR